jgi:hemolysin III
MSRIQTATEERWNVITHFGGFLFFVTASIFLLFKIDDLSTTQVAGIGLYLVCQLFLYAASTSYHYVLPGKLKFTLRKVDHISIYGSIAGTYTPVCLITLEQSNGYLILGIVWGIAIFGTIWKLFFTGKFEAFSSLLYLAMGWLAVLDFQTLSAQFSDLEMNLLIAGGVFFTVGIVFYAWNKLYFNHVIWHLFVLGGSISHFAMVYYIVAGV